MIDGALVTARAVHFTATLLLQGSICFRFFVAEPALGGASGGGDRPWLNGMAASAGIVAILSGAAWLLLLAAEITGASVSDAIADGTAWTLLTQTQFGIAWQARAAGFVLLAVCMIELDPARPARWLAGLALLLSVGLSGSIVWAGHGAATPGVLGAVHVAIDFLHLAAAGVWLGGLLPFTVLLLQSKPHARAELTRRFSLLATVSVLVLLPSGIANGWFMLGGIGALTGTLYGRLLLAKIALFFVMLAFAAVNRFVLTPQLASNAATSKGATNRLAIHSDCEIALGVAILAIVGVLGILPPEM